MNSELQKQIITLFHYALNSGGMLFLGTSETVGDLGNLFVALDRKAKLYQRKEDFQGSKRAALNRFLPTVREKDMTISGATGHGNKAASEKLSLRELTEQTLLQQLNIACAIVNSQGDILYLHGRTGMYLEPTPGEASINNILKMAREGLRRDLTIGLHKVARSKERVNVENLRVKTNGHFTLVNLTICPVLLGSRAILDSPLFLVILEETTTLDAQKKATPAASLIITSDNINHDAIAQIAELNEELMAKEEYLHAANEDWKHPTKN